MKHKYFIFSFYCLFKGHAWQSTHKCTVTCEHSMARAFDHICENCGKVDYRVSAHQKR